MDVCATGHDAVGVNIIMEYWQGAGATEYKVPGVPWEK